jgi:hypothetical protein
MDLNTPFAPPPDLDLPTMDLADGVKGMYRVLELISESSGNGNGEESLRYLRNSPIGFYKLIWRHS